MPERLRFLLDTNVLIPLQNSYQALSDNLTNFVRLASIGGHQLVYHPANIADFERDNDCSRRTRNLQHIKRFPALENPAPCPWNDASTGPNNACDNELLYALHCDAVHALVTEDRGIHAKARAKGLSSRTYTIQTAEDWLRRLHETRQVTLPKIQDVPLHSLTPELSNSFFNSLRDGYPGFDKWFRGKARENRMAWVYRDDANTLSAICVYHIQADQKITDEGESLEGNALKLCTFKVGETIRGRKLGELFLKASFRYATENFCENIFIHANAEHHDYLIRLLEDFGFEKRGTYKNDHVLERVIDSPAATGRRRRSRVLELPDGQKAVPKRHQHRRVELRGALPDVDRRRGSAAALPAARDVQRAALVGPRWRTLAAAAQ